jgi:chemotaxis response regulator CheB
MTPMLRVAVFNDSPTMRAAIRAAIRAAVEREPDMRVVTEQDSADDAAAVVARSYADAVIMDVAMPGVDGYQATREIMRRRPTSIVMVSSMVDARDAAVVFAALVQHLAAGFTASFASWLGSSTGHPVLIAEDGERAVPGCVYLPPEDHHIGLAVDLRIHLDGLDEVDGAAPAAGFRPSGDYLLASLARLGRRALGVVLSGMGRDGAEGAARLRQAGGHVVAQALESATVTGMPSAACRSGAAEAMLAPEDIARWLASRSGVV